MVRVRISLPFNVLSLIINSGGRQLWSSEAESGPVNSSSDGVKDVELWRVLNPMRSVKLSWII